MGLLKKTVNCKHCGTEHDAWLDKCPRCGWPNDVSYNRFFTIKMIGMGIIFAVVLALMLYLPFVLIGMILSWSNGLTNTLWIISSIIGTALIMLKAFTE